MIDPEKKYKSLPENDVSSKEVLEFINSDIGNVACVCIARNTQELESLGNATENACIKFLRVLEFPAENVRKKRGYCKSIPIRFQQEKAINNYQT